MCTRVCRNLIDGIAMKYSTHKHVLFVLLVSYIKHLSYRLYLNSEPKGKFPLYVIQVMDNKGFQFNSIQPNEQLVEGNLSTKFFPVESPTFDDML